MIQEVGFIKITITDIQGYNNESFFAGISVDFGHVVIKTVSYPSNAAMFTPQPKDSIEGRKIDALIDLIKKSIYGKRKVEFVTTEIKC